jgi:hypothetical protein
VPNPITEEHELPSIEAVLAGTMALMTGYGQASQAELDPSLRLRMGLKVIDNLELLIDHPQLSRGFREVLSGLQARWQAMSRCTEESGLVADVVEARMRARAICPLAAPKRLQ